MERLAEETIQHIFTYLKLEDLRNLVLVNRHFARIATPLYYDVTTREQMTDLIKLLVDESPLAQHVIRLHVPIWPKAARDEQTVDHLINLGIREQSTLPAGFLSLHKALSLDWMMALFLSLLPKIETLDMTTDLPESHRNAQSPSDLRDDLLATHDASLTTLQPVNISGTLFDNLREFNLQQTENYFSSDYKTFDSTIISYFLQIPTLRILNVMDCTEDWWAPGFNCDRSVSSVECLRLIRCDIYPATIEKILKSCRALTTFELQHNLRCHCHPPAKHSDYDFENHTGLNSSYRPDESVYNSVQATLVLHSQTLSRLCLSKKCSGAHLKDDISLEALDVFKNLQHLEIDKDVLYKYGPNYEPNPLAQRLPKSLKQFVYRDDRKDQPEILLRELCQLFRACERLESIELHDSEVDASRATALGIPDLSFEQAFHSPEDQNGFIIARKRFAGEEGTLVTEQIKSTSL